MTTITDATRTLAEMDAVVSLILYRLDEYARALGLPTENERDRLAAEQEVRHRAERAERAARAGLDAERRRIEADPDRHGEAVALTATLATEWPATAADVVPRLSQITAHLRTAPTSGYGSTLARPSADDGEVEAGVNALNQHAWVLAAVGVELGRSAEVAAALALPERGIHGVVSKGFGLNPRHVRDIPEAREILAEHDAAREGRRRW